MSLYEKLCRLEWQVETILSETAPEEREHVATFLQSLVEVCAPAEVVP